MKKLFKVLFILIISFCFVTGCGKKEKEVEKYKLELGDDEISFDFVELYKIVTDSDNFSAFKDMLYKMKDDLHLLIKFLRKNIGIYY